MNTQTWSYIAGSQLKLFQHVWIFGAISYNMLLCDDGIILRDFTENGAGAEFDHKYFK